MTSTSSSSALLTAPGSPVSPHLAACNSKHQFACRRLSQPWLSAFKNLLLLSSPVSFPKSFQLWQTLLFFPSDNVIRNDNCLFMLFVISCLSVLVSSSHYDHFGWTWHIIISVGCPTNLLHAGIRYIMRPNVKWSFTFTVPVSQGIVRTCVKISTAWVLFSITVANVHDTQVYMSIALTREAIGSWFPLMHSHVSVSVVAWLVINKICVQFWLLVMLLFLHLL